MKSVLISIQPQWCELIANGTKTIEVRKCAQKEVPFKVYMYQTRHKCRCRIINEVLDGVYNSGKVIGEFICDRVICCQAYYGNSGEKHLTNLFGIEVKQTCLTEEELFNYIVGNKKEGTGWLWHISDHKIYDEPKELGEFYYRLPEKVLEKGDYDCRKPWDCSCGDFPEGSDLCENCIFGGRVQLTRAPQSWQYVEVCEDCKAD